MIPGKDQNKFYCYILHSQKLQRFYTGSTIKKPDSRLTMHLSKHYGNRKYTSKASDWVIFLTIECPTIEEARYLEAHIKKMKSSTYIRNLKQYPEIITRLKAKYTGKPD